MIRWLLNLFNPARLLSLKGKAKRAKDRRKHQELRRELHDKLASDLGLPPIPWAARWSQ